MRGLARGLTSGQKATPTGPPQRSIDAGWRPIWQSGMQPRRVKHLLSTYGGTEDSVTWVFRCVSFIAETAASYHRQLTRDGQTVDHEDLPPELSQVLDHPNPRVTWFDFMDSVLTDLELVGNSFWVKDLTNPLGQPARLLRMRPDRLQIVPTDDGHAVAGYVYLAEKDAHPMVLLPTDVIHYRYPNPLDDWYGMGTVEAILRAVQGDLAVSDHVSNFFSNGARISGVLTVSGTLGETQFERLRRQFVEEYTGAGNAFKTLIAEQGTDFKQTSATPTDLAVTEVRRLSKDEILTGFGVPEFLLGGAAQGGVYKMEEAQNIFDRAMYPRVRRVAERTTYDWMRYYGSERGGSGYVLNLLPTNSEPRSTRIERGKSMVGGGATWNEVREEQGLSAIDHPDANRIVMPNGDLAPPSLSVPRKGVGTPQRRLPPARAGMKALPTASGEDWSTPEFPEGMEQLDLTNLESADGEVARILVDHQARMLRRGVPLMQTAMRGFFRDQQARLLRALHEAAGGKATSDWGFDDIWSDAAEDIALLEAFMPVADTLGEDAIEVPARVVGSDLRWDTSHPIIRALRDLIGLLVKRVNETTRKAVGEQVELGIRRGYSIPQIANGFAAEDYAGIGGVMDQAAEARAETIARSETAMVLNRAATATYEEAGVATVEVLDGTDHDDDCRKANGQTWTTEDAERNPIAHPNAVMEGTAVEPLGGVEAAYGAYWSGPALCIRTAGGPWLTVGPNHPVLTARGWVKADLLREGDEVVRRTGKRPSGSDSDINEQPARVEDVLGALRATGDSCWTVAAPEHFHGDGNFCQGEVEVVRADRPLRDVAHAPFRQEATQGQLVRGRAEHPAFAGPSARLQGGEGVPLAAPGGMSGRDVGGVAVAVPDVDPCVAQPVSDGAVADAEFLRELERRYACTVTLQQIVEVEVVAWEGHAYDLEVEGRAYFAEGYLVSNCVRTFIPIL